LRGRCLLNERHITVQWRELFRGKGITSAVVSDAHVLLDSLSPESPLRIRLATELEEIKKLSPKK
jgi:hypothetical protein